MRSGRLTGGARPLMAGPPVGVLVGFLLVRALVPAAQLEAQQLTVGPDGEFRTIGAALASAEPGDTVLVAPGTYAERLRIHVPLTLRGEGWPVVDGGGAGHVIEALAPLVLEGFVVRGSGARVDEEHAGVMLWDAPSSRIVGNRLEDVFYGVYLKKSPRSLVRGNHIEGKPFPPPRRGDGIRLWYSSHTQVLENRVRGTRDVVVYFSDSLTVADNLIEGGRYGLHYMYSNHNVFERNRFEANEVGAFLMYSVDIRMTGNVFASSAGLTGMGLGLKDADGIEASGNLIVQNVVGIHLDNSPRSANARNTFSDNLFLANQAGVRLLPSVQGNEFEGNDFVNNDVPVVVAGGAGPGYAARNRWANNHWSAYAGFDQNADGMGDTPYVHARLADDLLSRYPTLGLFSGSPALAVLEVVSRFFPLLRPEPVVIDSSPSIDVGLLPQWTTAARTEPAASAAWEGPAAEARPAGAQTGRGPTVWHAAIWILLASAATGALWRASFRRVT